MLAAYLHKVGRRTYPNFAQDSILKLSVLLLTLHKFCRIVNIRMEYVALSMGLLLVILLANRKAAPIYIERDEE